MNETLEKLKNSFIKTHTLTKILIILALFDAVFIVTMIIIFCVKDTVPDTLITCVLGASTGEALFSAAIKIIQIKKGETEETEETEEIEYIDEETEEKYNDLESYF